MANETSNQYVIGTVSAPRIQAERGTVNVGVRCLLNYGPESRSFMVLDVNVVPANPSRNADEEPSDERRPEVEAQPATKEQDEQEKEAEESEEAKADETEAGDENASQDEERRRVEPWEGQFRVYDVYGFLRAMTRVVALQDVSERFVDRGTVMFINNSKSSRYGVRGNIVFHSRQSGRRTAMLLPPTVAYNLFCMVRPYATQMPVQLPVQMSTRTRPGYRNGNIIRVNGSVLLVGQGSETVPLNQRDVDWIRFAVGSMMLADDPKRSVSTPGGYSLNLAEKIVQIPRARIRFNGEEEVKLASTVL